MHTEHKREAPQVDVGYETRDIDYSALGKTVIVFLFFVFLCFALVGGWFWLTHPQISSLLDARKPMPAINVQSNISVRTDISTLRQHETQVLSSSGPNPDGSLRIPIDQAMNLVAKRGLAHQTTRVKAVSPGTTIPQNALAPGEKPPISGDIGLPGEARP